MILYCDTSALVKLYIVEPQSDAVKALAAEAEAVAVCRIAWAEFHAAVARRAREVPTDIDAIEAAKQCMAKEWSRFVVLEANQTIMEKAGEFADAFALRGYDAVHLAAAHETMNQTQLPLSFACFDIRLNRAAKLLGMSVAFP